jgi:hypothetical protein
MIYISDQIGKGAYGCVRRAYRIVDRALVIVKFILKHKVQYSTDLSLFYVPDAYLTLLISKFFLSYHNLFTKTIIHIIIRFYHILF